MEKVSIMNRKLVIIGAVFIIVVIVAAVSVIVFLNAPKSSQSLFFTVTGREQNGIPAGVSNSIVSWNFSFTYNHENTLQNVNLFLNNGDMPFKTVPEVTKGWTNEYIWTPSDINANATITISWQGGTEKFGFQP
jgi:hypothetical protein